MALTWLKGMISRLSLNGSKLSRGSEDMDSADLIMDISNALVASVTEESWPDEGSRSASISVSLASRCDVGKELLVLREEGESQYVTLCCVPGRVPTLGLKTLDAWAARVATGLDPSAWLPGFLLDNSNNLMAAVRAADFLGCRLFQELMLEVQLLRVALGRNTEQTEADNQHVPLGSWSIPALSSLSKAAFQQLPCVRQQPESAPLPTGGEPSNSTANDCSQGELAISAVEEVQAGDGSGSASSDDEGAVGGSTIGSVPKQASVEEEWDELYGPVQPLDPAQVWGRGGQQLGPNADEEGLRGGEQEPQQQVHVPVRHVTPVQMEILVEALANSSLLQCLAASRSDVR
ncbi:hypothetical protein Vretimale_6743 [Volvox reticuliferus]|nr:hypothetical protein Vretimale_6743 [Volvox reticuliferus]